MSTSEQPALAVTVTFLPDATVDGRTAFPGDSQVRGTISLATGSSIPFSGWLELMGELERLAETARTEASGPVHSP